MYQSQWMNPIQIQGNRPLFYQNLAQSQASSIQNPENPEQIRRQERPDRPK